MKTRGKLRERRASLTHAVRSLGSSQRVHAADLRDGEDASRNGRASSPSKRNREVFGEKRGANRSPTKTFGDKHLYVPDPLGSVNHLLDASQNIAGTFSYWPYGELQSHTGANTPLQFVGALGYQTQIANRVYANAGYYRPDLATGQSEDSGSIHVLSGKKKPHPRRPKPGPRAPEKPTPPPRADETFTNAQCRQACKNLKAKYYEVCVKICEERRGQRSCNGLRNFCEHLTKHPNDPQYKNLDPTVCWNLWGELCTEKKPVPQVAPCPEDVRQFANCTDLEIGIECVVLSAGVVLCCHSIWRVCFTPKPGGVPGTVRTIPKIGELCTVKQ